VRPIYAIFADHNNGGEIYFKLTWEGATILLVFFGCGSSVDYSG
jgi:hypothetical protein